MGMLRRNRALVSDVEMFGPVIGTAPEEAVRPDNGCKGCQESGDRIDALTTQIANLSANVHSTNEKLTNVIGGLNAVGEQNNWIVENAGKVFTAFEEMRAQFAKGGLMGMVKGMKASDNATAE